MPCLPVTPNRNASEATPSHTQIVVLESSWPQTRSEIAPGPKWARIAPPKCARAAHLPELASGR